MPRDCPLTSFVRAAAPWGVTGLWPQLWVDVERRVITVQVESLCLCIRSSCRRSEYYSTFHHWSRWLDDLQCNAINWDLSHDLISFLHLGVNTYNVSAVGAIYIHRLLHTRSEQPQQGHDSGFESALRKFAFLFTVTQRLPSYLSCATDILNCTLELQLFLMPGASGIRNPGLNSRK